MMYEYFWKKVVTRNKSLKVFGDKEGYPGDFPVGPAVKTLCSQCRGSGIQSLVRELRSHIPQVSPHS